MISRSIVKLYLKIALPIEKALKKCAVKFIGINCFENKKSLPLWQTLDLKLILDPLAK